MSNLDSLKSKVEIDVSIVIPCLNEAETIEKVIRKIIEHHSHEYVYEIVVSDNGSTDGTLEILSNLPVRVVHAAKRGYGAALLEGIFAAKGAFIVMGDADDSYELEEFDKFVKPLEAGFDMVVGNRFQGSIQEGAMPWLHRWLGNPALSLLGRIFYGVKIGDFHCGIRSFKKTAVEQLRLKSSGMEFATEMIAKASKRGLRLTEIPTTLRKDGRSRPPHLNTWRDGWRHLKFMLAYSPEWLLLYPGLISLSMGGIVILFDVIQEIEVFGRSVGVLGLIIGVLLFVTGALLIMIGITVSKIEFRNRSIHKINFATQLQNTLESKYFWKLCLALQIIVTFWFLHIINRWFGNELNNLDEITRIKYGLLFLLTSLLNLLMFMNSIITYFINKEIVE